MVGLCHTHAIVKSLNNKVRTGPMPQTRTSTSIRFIVDFLAMVADLLQLVVCVRGLTTVESGCCITRTNITDNAEWSSTIRNNDRPQDTYLGTRECVARGFSLGECIVATCLQRRHLALFIPGNFLAVALQRPATWKRLLVTRLGGVILVQGFNY